MEIIQTGFDGMMILVPKVFEDNRGYFFESYNHQFLEKAGAGYRFVQDNQSRSMHGVIRGLHYQIDPHAQTKLVRVLAGRIFDVAVDLRKGSPTFGRWYGVELTTDNHYQLLIPKGFAHGFSVLSTEALVLYKTDSYYHPASERGILFNDPELAVDWKINETDRVVSERDSNLPSYRNAEFNFSYNPS